jgi:predicted transcriptional regulator
MERPEALIFKGKPAKIMIALSDKKQSWYISSLAKAAEATYVFTSQFVNKCEEAGIISVEKHGRTKSIALTEKGTKIAEEMTSILDAIGKGPEQQQPPPQKAQ